MTLLLGAWHVTCVCLTVYQKAQGQNLRQGLVLLLRKMHRCMQHSAYHFLCVSNMETTVYSLLTPTKLTSYHWGLVKYYFFKK